MKHLFKALFIIIIVLCVLTMVSCGIKEPAITEGEFPIYLEYEKYGARYIIDDIVVCSYNGIDTTGFIPSRWYSVSLKNESNTTLMFFVDNTESKLTKGRINEEAYIRLHIGDGGYYLGDPDDKDHTPYISYDEQYKTEPKVTHIDVTKLTNEQLEEIFGIKIIRFEFSSPIENTFE